MASINKVFISLGWCWVGFWAVLGFAVFPQSGTALLVCIIWGAILAPPIWSHTAKFGLRQNLLGRVGVILVSSIVLTSIGTPQPPIRALPAASMPATPPVVRSFPRPSPAPIAIAPSPLPTPLPPSVWQPQPEPPIDPPSSVAEPSSTASLDRTTPIRSPVSGSCDCPYDRDRRGNLCSSRSAYLRPNGSHPICYIGDR